MFYRYSGFLFFLLFLFPSLVSAATGIFQVNILPPPPDLKMSVEFFEPSGNRLLDIGESGSLFVTLENCGEGTAFDVEIFLSEQDHIEGLSFPSRKEIGTIAPGSSTTARIELSASGEFISKKPMIQVRLGEANGHVPEPVSIAINQAQKPIQDKVAPRIIVTNPNSNGQRGVKLVLEEAVCQIQGLVIDDNEIVGFRINGQRVSLEGDGYFNYLARLDLGENIFNLIAIDSSGNVSEEHLVIDGGVRNVAGEFIVSKGEPVVRKPNLWLLSIGVSNYKNEQLKLKFADIDASAIVREMKQYNDGIYGEIFSKKILNSEATRANILLAVTSFLGQAAPGDVVFVYIAGHGIKHSQTGSYYFLPYDATSENLLFQGLKWSDFEEAIRIVATNVDKIVLVVDTCHSGAFDVAMRSVDGAADLVSAMNSAEGQYILNASKAGEASLEDESYNLPGETDGHGAFTYALLEGLRGAANLDKNNYISVSELFSHVAARVPRLTNGKQHPYQRVKGTDLPLVKTK